MIAADPTAHRIPGGRTIVRTRAVDETGVLDIVFFNQEYRKNSLHRGRSTSSTARWRASAVTSW